MPNNSQKGFTRQNFQEKTSDGFTLVELMIVVVMIAMLATIVLASLSGARAKAGNAKVAAQLANMRARASFFLGAVGAAYIVATPYSGTIAGSPGTTNTGTAATGTLFNDPAIADYSLYSLASSLPAGTNMYYGWDGISPGSGGKWFFAASTTTGGYCVDWNGGSNTYTGSALATLTVASWTTAGVFPNATVAGNYLCN